MYVSNRVRLASDPALSAAVAKQVLPVSTAEVLLRVPEAERATLIERAKTEKWTTEQARATVLEHRQTPTPVERPAATTRPPHFEMLIGQIQADLPILKQVAGMLDPAERAELHALAKQVVALTAAEA